MTSRLATLAVTLLCLCALALAQPRAPKSPGTQATRIGDFSGTYSFLREGEDLQINVRNGKLDGFASRFGDSETDKDVLLQHLIEKSSVSGDAVRFTTSKIHGVWFEFAGKVRHGDGKAVADQGYNVLEGTITRYDTAPDGKVSAKSREAQFRSLPADFGFALPGSKKK
jgi:hypothetical protein